MESSRDTGEQQGQRAGPRGQAQGTNPQQQAQGTRPVNPFAPALVQAPVQLRQGGTDIAEEGKDPYVEVPSFNTIWGGDPRYDVEEPTSDRDLAEINERIQAIRKLQEERRKGNRGFKLAEKPERVPSIRSLNQGAFEQLNPIIAQRYRNKLTRGLFTLGDLYYQESGTNFYLPLKQLKYYPRYPDTPERPPFYLRPLFNRWCDQYAVCVGLLPAAWFVEYLTRPGTRPKDYLVVDMREAGPHPGLGTFEPLEGKIYNIPFPGTMGLMDDPQIEAMSNLVTKGQGEHGLITEEGARVMEEIKRAKVRFGEWKVKHGGLNASIMA
ncbi:hypothetical protein ABW19_dt0206784 [Dactylella cylindrospora]|nr:hypothetical protein ABW19_dt0206784 [Dactylella cylindrospora]